MYLPKLQKYFPSFGGLDTSSYVFILSVKLINSILCFHQPFTRTRFTCFSRDFFCWRLTPLMCNDDAKDPTEFYCIIKLYTP